MTPTGSVPTGATSRSPVGADSTRVVPVLDAETIEELTPPCEQGIANNTNRCGPMPAEWIDRMQCPVCCLTLLRLYCAQHHDRLITGGTWKCIGCGTSRVPMILLSCERLNQRPS